MRRILGNRRGALEEKENFSQLRKRDANSQILHLALSKRLRWKRNFRKTYCMQQFDKTQARGNDLSTPTIKGS